MSNMALQHLAADVEQTNPLLPTISKSFNGLPTLGPILETGQRRALIGWNHKKDTPEGLLTGRLWCWVAEGTRGGLQVYDAPVNRSPFPVGTGRGPNAAGGCLVDCGVANFGMVRMFHPWWCPYSRVPKDMNQSDKRMCRHRYRQLIAKSRPRPNTGNGNRRGGMQMVDSEAEDDSDDELTFLNRRKAAKKRQRRGVLKHVQRRVGKGDGTQDKPVVLDLVDDDGPAASGSLKLIEEGARGERGGSLFRGLNGGEQMRAIEESGYQEVEAGAAGFEAGADFELLINAPGTQSPTLVPSQTEGRHERSGTMETVGSGNGRENDPFFVA